MKKNIVLSIAILVGSVVLDQITKVWAVRELADHSIPLFFSWLSFRLTINYGGAFSMQSGNNVMFFIVTIVGLPLFVWWLISSLKKSALACVSLSMIIGGTIGNAIDRALLGTGFFNGGVRDFIAVDWFATFNVADCFLTIGMGLFLLELLFLGPDALIRSKKEKKENESE